MNQCAYCLEYKVEDHSELRPGANKILQFPNGQKLAFRSVCYDCNHLRYDWQAKIDAEKLQEAERKRQWHKDVAERREQNRAAIEARRVDREAARQTRAELREARQHDLDMTKLANIEAQIGVMLKSRASFEAQMSLLVNSRDKLRKKYFQNDDKNT